MPTEPTIREKRIERLRKRIAEGTYETPEKLAAAVEAMLCDLDSPRRSAESLKKTRGTAGDSRNC